jgi:DNA polymerase III delta prime subunit
MQENFFRKYIRATTLELPGFVRILKHVVELSGPVSVLLDGPPGVGKTTASRALAIGRALEMLPQEKHQIGTERGLRMVLQGVEISWYRSLSLVGLTKELADSTLFGLKPKGASNVAPRVGIFEQAMTNAGPDDATLSHEHLKKAAKDRGAWTPIVTGGVVLLDEIGDAEEWLQLKLLRILNKEKVFRVQGEGEDRWGFMFRGIVALATCKNLDDVGGFRRDLLQRIGQHRIHMPSLSECSKAYRLKLISTIVAQFQKRARDDFEELQALPEQNGPVVAPFWIQTLERRTRAALTASETEKLADLDWSTRDEFRGLYAVTEQALTGHSLEEAISRLELNRIINRRNQNSEDDADRLERYFANGHTVAEGWQADKVSWAARLNDRLKNHDSRLSAILQTFSFERARLKKLLENILRRTSPEDTEV